MKEELTARVPRCRDASSFREMRRILRYDFGGYDAVLEELRRTGFVDDDDKLTTGTKPFNLFARVASGQMEQPGMAREQLALVQYQDRFVVCCNRPENDSHWDSVAPEWVGKASMGCRHRFLTTKDLKWKWFNALVFGMHESSENDEEQELQVAIDFLQDLKQAALTYVANVGGWSKKLGRHGCSGAYFLEARLQKLPFGCS